MITSSISCASRLAACFVLPLTILSAQQPESSFNYSEPDEPIAIAYGQSCNSSIGTTTDVDQFVFCGKAGELVWISIQATANNMDPVMELYDQNFVLIDNTWCSNQCSLRHGVVLPADGSYTIVVSDAGLNETGPFTLGLERIPAVVNARRLPYNTTLNDYIDGGVDVDWFAMHAVAGPPLRVNVTATANNMDPSVAILDDTGAVLFSNSCSNQCSLAINWTAPATGTYYLRLHEGGANEAGAYSVSLNSLVAAPPTTLASAFESLGLADGVGGACGIPLLTGEGRMDAGSDVVMHVRNLPSNRVVFLAASGTAINLPLFGGVLVPNLDFVLTGFATSLGDLSLTVLTVPAGVPPGTELFFQAFTIDPNAPQGISGSNAVRGISP